MSRYYDPQTHRFVNADGYFATGWGILDTNMNIYCGNNPINYCDPTGEFWISALIFASLAIACTVALTGSSIKPEPYKSQNDAAKAFAKSIYSSSLYIRHEYSAEIYSRTIDGKTTYNYTSPRAGKPHSVGIGNKTPAGTTMVAYAHTHPNSNYFSPTDISSAKKLGVNAYVIGPNLELQQYNLATASVKNLGIVSPNELSDAQKEKLVSDFQVSWDSHISEGCEFGCNNMAWPTQ